MSSLRRHAVVVSFPAPGQLNPTLDLANLLHLRGFLVTFVNTSSGLHRILQTSQAFPPESDLLRFETIPDGYSLDSSGAPNNEELRRSINRTCAAHLGQLLRRLKQDPVLPPVSCVVANFLIASEAVGATEEMGIPFFVLWTTSACSLLGSLHLRDLIRRGYAPLKDQSFLTNEYLDTPIDWIPGFEGIRLRDLSSFIRTTNPNQFFLNCEMEEVACAQRASGVILNTFDEMEGKVLDAIKASLPRTLAVGPLFLLLNQMKGVPKNLNLFEEDRGYKEWLNSQRHASVVYACFGSLARLTSEQLMEFAWGLADSKHPFLLSIRPDLVENVEGGLPEEFIREVEGRGWVTNWCDQGRVLRHSSIGGFLTHGGWNSMLESVCSGVPMLIWPGFADQFTNCRFACEDWGIAMEIEQEVKREQIRKLVVELMQGERGQEMRKKVMKWKEMAEQATNAEGGSSYANLMRLTEALCRNEV
ncbi:7-deoxyloganetin glucosyltransferase-like [Zingiber officinale]|uniref:Glycosyltransferase n=1 Tax=Zingiber officinale TaxID=94328 RepID=A0A8J5ET95_ZINOF|nr:7-deoxyloganetin glucosyltransferase-like [Zingiber officinale]KAG6474410.1 hypothetical protein ZIOFF_068345 [Zingiber officinale]